MDGQNAFNLLTKIYNCSGYINRDAYTMAIFALEVNGLQIAQASTEEDLIESMIKSVDFFCEDLKTKIRNREPLK